MSSIDSFQDADLALYDSSSCFQLDAWNTSPKILALKLASYLTDPICKVREYYYSLYTLGAMYQTTVERVTRAALLTLGMLVYAVLSPITTPVGMALRGLVTTVQSEPYVYLKQEGEGRVLPSSGQITIAYHNTCYMPGGYSITDGQVTPPSDQKRMEANIAAIKRLQPDIVSLCEVPDVCDAEFISRRLPEYPYIIPVAGVRALGPSSGMYIASKYEIIPESIQFVPFIKDVELTGRGKFSEKGYLSFDIRSRGQNGSCATIVSTHLQHSEIVGTPTQDEQTSRAAQMRKIAAHIQQKVDSGASVIFVGDLNQEEEELSQVFKEHQIEWLRDPRVVGRPTWGGDQWCAELMGKPVSKPAVLDYAFAAGKVREIATQIFETGFRSPQFLPGAGSDHYLLFHTVTLTPSELL